MAQHKALILALLMGFSAPLAAEVLEQADNGFVIEMSAEVEASPKQAYQQFVRIGEWWDGSHSWFGKAKNFSLEPVAGGCFCEIEGARQVQHMRVSFVDPNKEVRLLGGLGPLQMMAVHGAMSWRFEATELGTKITQRYTVSGYAKDGLGQLASVVDQVQTSQLQRLVSRLNAKSL